MDKLVNDHSDDGESSDEQIFHDTGYGRDIGNNPYRDDPVGPTSWRAPVQTDSTDSESEQVTVTVDGSFVDKNIWIRDNLSFSQLSFVFFSLAYLIRHSFLLVNSTIQEPTKGNIFVLRSTVLQDAPVQIVLKSMRK